MVGQTLARPKGVKGEVIPPYFSVKEAVFPFNKFPGVDPILGPEMRSTGEVMGAGAPSARPCSRASSARLAPAAQGHGVITVKNATRPRRGGRARPARRWASRSGGHQGHGGGDRRGRRAGEAVNKVTAGRTSSTWSRPARSSSCSPPSTRRAPRSPIAPHPHRGAGQPRHLLHHDGRLRSGGGGMKHQSILAGEGPLQELHAELAKRARI